MGLILNWLYWIAGMTVWFPSLSVLTLGNSTGLQLSLIFFSLIAIIQFSTNFKYKRDYVILVISVFWISSLVISTVFSVNLDKSINGLLMYMSCIIIFITVATSYHLTKAGSYLIDGYLFGGAISSIYAVYQFIGFNFAWTGTALFQNNPSFPSYADASIHSRAFAFAPEPGVLATLVVPAIFLCLYKIDRRSKRVSSYKIVLGLLLIGILVATSMGGFISIPLVIFFSLLLNYKQSVFALKKFFSRIFFVGIIALFIISGYSTFSENLSSLGTLERIQNVTEDGSFIVRLSAIATGLKIFEDYPVAGCGVLASQNEFWERFPPAVALIEDKQGLDSLPVMILAEQGIIGFGALVVTFYYVLKRTRCNYFLFATMISIILMVTIQTSYFLLNHIWAILGLGYSSASLEKKGGDDFA